MTPPESVETLDKAASRFVSGIEEAMRNAEDEEELKMASESLLSPLLRSIGVDPKPRYERLPKAVKATYGGIRPDAVHGRVVIEYEPPRSFGHVSNVRHALGQVRDYMIAEAAALNPEPRKALPQLRGVGFDGEKVFFVRFTGITGSGPISKEEEFAVDGPVEFDNRSARTFLSHLRTLSRLPLTAENLVRAFGPRSKIASKSVEAFVQALLTSSSTRVTVFFNEWKRLFGIVYGEQFQTRQEEETAELRKLYPRLPEASFQQILFGIHTYFALLMKLLAADLLTLRETEFNQNRSGRLVHCDRTELLGELSYIEDGSVFALKGVTNFIEGDFFQWYLDVLSGSTVDAIQVLARELSQFEPSTGATDKDIARDLLKRLYEDLVPQRVRHRLGEYYTPDWLAELVISRTGYNGDPRKRFLDPACGSGTFLILAVGRALDRARRARRPMAEAIREVLENVWGFDLNPLAVIASRTNYLFALGEELPDLGSVEIPVYLADSVLWPQMSRQTRLDSSRNEATVQTSVGPLHVPASWLRSGGRKLKDASRLIETFTKDNFPVADAVENLRGKGFVGEGDEPAVTRFYEELSQLNAGGRDGIWARFLRNAFAPVLAGKFDYVIGNPPWIRWGYLAKEYREATAPLWREYGLFSLKGYSARLGGGEKDFSMLFLYACADNYLETGGRLGFLITREVVKSTGAGEGFRRFVIGTPSSRKTPDLLRVVEAHDFVQVKPFESAANKTAAIIVEKGDPTTYPVPYVLWRRSKGRRRLSPELSLDEATPLLTSVTLEAKPVSKPTSSWQTSVPGQKAERGVQGASAYKAIIGARCEPYGVFWLEIVDPNATGGVIVRNMTKAGKRKIPRVEMAIEPDLILPAIRGKDVTKWGVKSHVFVIVSQDASKKAGISEPQMRARWPKTYHYLNRFKAELESRAAFKKYYEGSSAPFYSQFNISDKTFSPFRVAIKRMASRMEATVVSKASTPWGQKDLLPLDTISVIPATTAREAHYVCAMVNSGATERLMSSIASPGRGFATPSILSNIGLPRFDETNPSHLELSECSKRAHAARLAGDAAGVERAESRIEELSGKVFAKRT